MESVAQSVWRESDFCWEIYLQSLSFAFDQSTYYITVIDATALYPFGLCGGRENYFLCTCSQISWISEKHQSLLLTSHLNLSVLLWVAR